MLTLYKLMKVFSLNEIIKILKGNSLKKSHYYLNNNNIVKQI